MTARRGWPEEVRQRAYALWCSTGRATPPVPLGSISGSSPMMAPVPAHPRFADGALRSIGRTGPARTRRPSAARTCTSGRRCGAVMWCAR